MVSYVVKLKIRLKAENGELGNTFPPHQQTVPVLRNTYAIYDWFAKTKKNQELLMMKILPALDKE